MKGEALQSKPIFISALGRSGTTALILSLAKSEQIKVLYDVVHYMRFSYKRYEPVNERYSEILEHTKDRVEHRLGKKIELEKIRKNIEKHNIIDNSVVYDELMRGILDITNGERWLDRTVVQWESIPDFLNMFPHGKVIHMIRDPRSILASFKKMTFLPGIMYLDILFTALSMFNYLQENKISKFERVMVVRYEDIILSPEETIRSICNFLDIEFSKTMLDISSHIDQFGRVFDGNSSFVQNRTQFDSQSISKWKTTLTSKEIYLSEMILRDKLRFYGYELSGVDLAQSEWNELYELLHTEYLSKRYFYWLKYGNGKQVFPDTENAY